jgi:penicillin-insensitive murein DD-endopeptidase
MKELLLTLTYMTMALMGVCQVQIDDSLLNAVNKAVKVKDHREALMQYCHDHPDNGKPSTSSGTVSKGALANGKLIPFAGPNFQYYDTLSYLDDRAYVHDRVKKATLQAYELLAVDYPDQRFTIMECSKRQGGKIWPHRTHQNGLSIDFMVPLVKEDEPYYGLDTIGFTHYLLEFNADGTWQDDAAVSIDLDLIAAHLLALHRSATEQGLAISKVLLKGEFLTALFQTPHGKLLKAKGLYFPTQLEPLINGLHDNHYHVDFKLL